MLKEIISKQTQQDLAILKEAGILNNFYMAGGTGLALQIKHRLSIDLDFFSKQEIDTSSLSAAIKKCGKFSVEKEAQNTLSGRFNKTNIMFFGYDYPLLFPPKILEDIKAADPRDIGCMKISAISSRGSKKDFIDLFFICQEIIPFKKLLVFFEKKYKSVDYNMVHILKSIIYFTDADKEPMPKMLKSVSWSQVKKFLREMVRMYKTMI